MGEIRGFLTPVVKPVIPLPVQKGSPLDDVRELDAADELVEERGELWRKIRPNQGRIRNTLWDDINETKGNEDTGYPTQKPLPLYERIILVSSNEDDLVLDPFCGCATTPIAAERLGRQ